MTINKKYIKNQKAFSLIGVTIAAVIMGTLSILFIEMMQNQLSSTTLMESKLLEHTMYRDIENYLSDSIACGKTLKYKIVKPHGTAPEKEVAAIIDSKDNKVYDTNSLYFNSLQIKKMIIEPKASFLSTQATGAVDFVITFKRKKVASSAFSEKTYKIPIHVILNNSQEIDSCEMKGTFPACSPGEVLTASNAGNLECIAPLDYSKLNCSNGKVFQGFNASGQKICVAKGSGGGGGCQGKTFPASEASPNFGYSPHVCIVSSSPHGTTSGHCKPGHCGLLSKTVHGICLGYSVGGSCKYECNNGSWIKITNTCTKWQGTGGQ